jgi:hypothetical protein
MLLFFIFLHACAVIFTIGPACQSVEVLADILKAGGTCARIDLTVRLLFPCHTLVALVSCNW